MRSSSLINNTVAISIGVVLSKIINFLYFIPLYHIIGNKGGALYSYAYIIYTVFMSFMSFSIVFSITKVTAYYQALGYNNVKRRAFTIGKIFSFCLGICAFLLVFVFSPVIARMIVGNISDGNTLVDITTVIRIVSFSFFVIPVLNIYRGYFDGHRITNTSSISIIIEQYVMAFVSVIFSLLAYKVFKLPLVWVSSFALLGLLLGPLFSYVYLFVKWQVNKNKFNRGIRKVVEPIIDSKTILNKIILYMLFFSFCAFFKSLYGFIDITTVVRALVKYAHFNVNDAENVISIMSIWANKFNSILLAISILISNSFLSKLAKIIKNKDKTAISTCINQGFSLLIILLIPITFSISFLSTPIWNLLYGTDKYGPSILSYLIFLGLIMGIFYLIFSVFQSFKEYKIILYSLLSGLIVKLFLNTSLINAFYKMGLPAYYGAITASILGYLVTIIICFIVLHVKYGINFESFIKNTIDVLCITFVVFGFLFLVKSILPIKFSGFFSNVLIIIFYLLICFLLYFILLKRTKVFKNVGLVSKK